MANLNDIYSKLLPLYQKAEDQDFPVSKLRLFMNVLWEALTNRELDEQQKTTLKQLIDLLNLLDEHKHESQKELIQAMLPSISPLLETMPTLGYTGTVTFTHLVPMYQHYLPAMELMVRSAHAFNLEETLLYYEITIFDHLFLVHLFENEANLNIIELVATIKAIILTNALVYDYHQHMQGRSISFFTFLERGGKTHEELPSFLVTAINAVKDSAKSVVTNPTCLEAMDFITTKLLDTTKKASSPNTTAQQNQEQVILDQLHQAPISTNPAPMPTAMPSVQPPLPVAPPAAPLEQPLSPAVPPVADSLPPTPAPAAPMTDNQGL